MLVRRCVVPVRVVVRDRVAVLRPDHRVKALHQSAVALDLRQKNLYNRKVANFPCHLIIQVGWHSQFFGVMGFMPIFYLCFPFITHESAGINRIDSHRIGL